MEISRIEINRNKLKQTAVKHKQNKNQMMKSDFSALQNCTFNSILNKSENATPRGDNRQKSPVLIFFSA